MITTVCKISYGSQTVPPIVPAVQGDTGRAISFEIADFTPPAGATATYFILKPSGEAIYNSATITDNSILCELTAQSLAEAGENRMQVRVLQGENIVTSFEVILMVRTFLGDNAIESGTEMNIFDQAVEQATEQFQENAEQIVEEVIESIPADYTALTEEVGELNERLQDKAFDIGSYNRLDVSKVQAGIITNTGAIVADTSGTWVYSDYIPVTAGETIYCSLVIFSASNFALYDKNYNIVSNSNNITSPYTVPANVAFIRVTIQNQYKATAYVSSRRGFDTFKGISPYFHEKLESLEDGLYNPYRKGNLINKTKLTSGAYVNGAVDGSLAYASGFYATDYIPVTPGMQYYANQNYLFRGYAAFYNSNKEYISGYGNGAGLFWYCPLTAPANAAYARFTILAANVDNAWLSEANRMASKPETYSDALDVRSQFVSPNPAEYTGDEITVFTKILCIGDSLTDGFFNENGGSRLVIRKRSYPAKLQALTGIECTNLGESGMTSAQWYTAHGSDNLSGYDACIIQLGVNDQLQNVSEADMDTALSNIITKVKGDNNGIKIFVATIIPANGYMTDNMKARSQMVRDFVSNLNDANVYLVDMWTYGHTDDYLAYDAGHLSALGYLRLAEDYKAYISSIISNNKSAFRYVQFIGTNYAYNGMTYTREITY